MTMRPSQKTNPGSFYIDRNWLPINCSTPYSNEIFLDYIPVYLNLFLWWLVFEPQLLLSKVNACQGGWFHYNPLLLSFCCPSLRIPFQPQKHVDPCFKDVSSMMFPPYFPAFQLFGIYLGCAIFVWSNLNPTLDHHGRFCFTRVFVACVHNYIEKTYQHLYEVKPKYIYFIRYIPLCHIIFTNLWNNVEIFTNSSYGTSWIYIFNLFLSFYFRYFPYGKLESDSPHTLSGVNV